MPGFIKKASLTLGSANVCITCKPQASRMAFRNKQDLVNTENKAYLKQELSVCSWGTVYPTVKILVRVCLSQCLKFFWTLTSVNLLKHRTANYLNFLKTPGMVKTLISDDMGTEQDSYNLEKM